VTSFGISGGKDRYPARFERLQANARPYGLRLRTASCAQNDAGLVRFAYGQVCFANVATRALRLRASLPSANVAARALRLRASLPSANVATGGYQPPVSLYNRGCCMRATASVLLFFMLFSSIRRRTARMRVPFRSGVKAFRHPDGHAQRA